VTESVHLNARGINLHSGLASYISDIDSVATIAVRKLADNDYSLVVGLTSLIKAKLFNFSKVKAIVTDLSRDNFIKVYDIENNNSRAKEYTERSKEKFEILDINDIFIPSKYSSTKVSEEKISRIKNYYIENKQIDKPVVLRRKYYLVDGYARYVVARQLNLNKLLVKYDVD
jgi:ParB-like chromosome segregation protein Spo0J